MIVESSHITEVYGPVQALRNYLQNKNNEFLYIAHPFSYSSLKRSKAILYKNGHLKKEFIGPKNLGPKLFHYLRDIFFIFRLLCKNKKEVKLYIGVNNLNALVGICLRGLGRVEKVIYYVIDYTAHRFNNILLNKLYFWVDRFCSRNADYIWSLSDRIAKTKMKQGASERRSLTVPVGVELKKIKLIPINQINRQRIVIVSHLTKAKGIQLVVDAMSEIVKRFPEAELVIIGVGPYENELKNMLLEYNLKEKIKFLGSMEHDKLFELLPSCGIGLAPYSTDADNIAYYADVTKPKEYLACGLPVIITKVPWIAEEIEKRPMGIAIDYAKSALINAIEKLLSDNEFYISCRKNALDFASKLGWNKIFDTAFSKIEDNI